MNNKKSCAIIELYKVGYNIMEDCIFCKIINNEIPSSKVYEDDDILAFKDINPQAPVHIIVIPKKHIRNILELNDESLLAKIHRVIKKIVKEQNLEEQGFRLVTNTGEYGCQTVKHLHFHILGGIKLSENL